VFSFDQTHPAPARDRFTVDLSRVVSPGVIMAIPKNNTHKDYVRYAAHCLDMVPATKDQDDRSINAKRRPNG
jgi:hypothetical protein